MRSGHRLRDVGLQVSNRLAGFSEVAVHQTRGASEVCEHALYWAHLVGWRVGVLAVDVLGLLDVLTALPPYWRACWLREREPAPRPVCSRSAMGSSG